MIVAAQRAYAERESCEMRQTEMKEELAKEAAQWQARANAAASREIY